MLTSVTSSSTSSSRSRPATSPAPTHLPAGRRPPPPQAQQRPPRDGEPHAGAGDGSAGSVRLLGGRRVLRSCSGGLRVGVVSWGGAGGRDEPAASGQEAVDAAAGAGVDGAMGGGGGAGCEEEVEEVGGGDEQRGEAIHHQACLPAPAGDRRVA
eukprot:748375-Hanusia_phi.AAC.2